jgi:hypothetical protein
MWWILQRLQLHDNLRTLHNKLYFSKWKMLTLFSWDSLQCNNLPVRHLQFQLSDLHINHYLHILHYRRNSCQRLLRALCAGVCLQLHSLILSGKLHTKLCNLCYELLVLYLQYRVQSDVKWDLWDLSFSDILQFYEQIMSILLIKLHFMHFRVFLRFMRLWGAFIRRIVHLLFIELHFMQKKFGLHTMCCWIRNIWRSMCLANSKFKHFFS